MTQELPDEGNFARVTIRADPDGTGTRDAVFEWSTGDDQSPLTVTETKRTETQAISGTPLTLLGDLLDVDVPTENADIALDFGSSTFAIDVGGVVTASQTMPDGSPCRWGDGSGAVGEATQTDAEGCSPHVKMAVFGEWLRHSRQSSIQNVLGEGGGGPATLEYLTHREGGLHDPLEVVFESPSVTYSAGSVASADIQLTAVEVASLDQALDALENDGR